MAKSLSEYIADRFYNEIMSAIQNYIEGNEINLHLYVENIHRIGAVEVTDFRVKKMWVDDLAGEHQYQVPFVLPVSEVLL